jgi:hypothetical protein
VLIEVKKAFSASSNNIYKFKIKRVIIKKMYNSIPCKKFCEGKIYTLTSNYLKTCKLNKTNKLNTFTDERYYNNLVSKVCLLWFCRAILTNLPYLFDQNNTVANVFIYSFKKMYSDATEIA